MSRTPAGTTMPQAGPPRPATLAQASDMAAVEANRAHEAKLGWDAAKAGYLTGDEAMQVLDGVAPARV